MFGGVALFGVSAVSSMFIGASNELGEFESGVTARWFGLIPAVVLGGIAATPLPCDCMGVQYRT